MSEIDSKSAIWGLVAGLVLGGSVVAASIRLWTRKLQPIKKHIAFVGQPFPSATLWENNFQTKVETDDAFKNKRIVLFGVPGAFTSTCSNTHLPSYLEQYNALKRKEVDEIICVSVNDSFVMTAWGAQHQVGNKIRMLSDPHAELTKALGLDVESKRLGFIRSKRYSMVIDNGIIQQINVEPASGATCSLANNIKF